MCLFKMDKSRREEKKSYILPPLMITSAVNIMEYFFKVFFRISYTYTIINFNFKNENCKHKSTNSITYLEYIPFPDLIGANIF